MILGDSLQVMTSLARREDLAGKVQMIYMDPPYGINYKSNFQPDVGTRSVTDTDSNMTREPEMVRAYRDTWTLGIHSYLAYLRDRLILCRELLADSGSVFVQISDEHVHRVRDVLDEVFGLDNGVSIIYFRKKTMPLGGAFLEQMGDYILWYAKDKDEAKKRFNRLYTRMEIAGDFHWNNGEMPNGERRKMEAAQAEAATDVEPFRLVSMWPPSFSASAVFPVDMNGEEHLPPKGQCWPTNPEGMRRLVAADRLFMEGRHPRYVMKYSDYALVKLSPIWSDTIGARGQAYVVETSPTVVERCMLMTTRPGDLVLDPTCGGGTTAYVAEQWGRRWITVDTSRVALTLARQRLLTALFPHYKVRGDSADDGAANPSLGFVYESIPHITLKSVAQNVALDSIVEQHRSILEEKLTALNSALSLSSVNADLRRKLKAKLGAKEKAEGKRAITDADHRRWVLPEDGWEEWEVPFDTDPDWPEPLQKALTEFRTAWRVKMDEVNGLIAASAEQEEVVDQPEVEKGVSRVTGPFTMEAVMPAELTLSGEEFGGAPEEDLKTFDGAEEPTNAEAFLDRMLRYLKDDGVRFPNNKVAHFERLEFAATGDVIHAEGEWATEDGDAPNRVAVSFGPEHGPITAVQVEDAIRAANRIGFDDLVFAGFSFDGTAQATIQEASHRHLAIHMAHIAPDVQMGDLLKTNKQQNSQLFTVFGSPRTKLTENDGEWTLEMQGVDVYDPVENTIHPTGADKVAAWFLDSDYDGRTFCIPRRFSQTARPGTRSARR